MEFAVKKLINATLLFKDLTKIETVSYPYSL